MSDPAEAYFCGDDVLSIGALSAVQDAGLSVPGDIGLIGLNDMEMAGWENIDLTTIRQPIAADHRILDRACRGLDARAARALPRSAAVSLPGGRAGNAARGPRLRSQRNIGGRASTQAPSAFAEATPRRPPPWSAAPSSAVGSAQGPVDRPSPRIAAARST
jgi:hypothetical protein